MKNNKTALRILKRYISEAIMQEFSMIDTMYATVGPDIDSDVSMREDAIENHPSTILANTTDEDLADHLEDDEDIFGPVPPGSEPYYVELDPYSSDTIAGTRNIGKY